MPPKKKNASQTAVAVKKKSNQSKDTEFREKNYALNQQRALERKLQSCSKDDMTVNPADPNNFVITFSTAAFELAREAIESCLHLPSDGKSNRNITKHTDKDQEGSHTAQIIRIRNWSAIAKPPKSQLNGTCCVTINIYLTTSSCLINGADASTFVDILTPQLRSHFTTLSNEIATANENFQQAILAATGPKETADIQNAIAPPPDVIDEEPLVMPKKCKRCKKNIKTNAAQCEICDAWSHFKCDAMSETEISTYQATLSYICKGCNAQNQVHTNSTKTPTTTAPSTALLPAIPAHSAVAPISAGIAAAPTVTTTSCTAPITAIVSTASMRPQIQHNHVNMLPAIGPPLHLHHIANIHTTNPGGQNHQMPHAPTREKEEIQTTRLTEKEAVLEEKEKRLRTKERQLNKREEEVERMELQQRNQAQQNAAMKTLVSQLEKETLELKEENRLLLIQTRASGNRNTAQNSQANSENAALTQVQLCNTIQSQLITTMQSLNSAIANLTSATENTRERRNEKPYHKKKQQKSNYNIDYPYPPPRMDYIEAWDYDHVIGGGLYDELHDNAHSDLDTTSKNTLTEPRPTQSNTITTDEAQMSPTNNFVAPQERLTRRTENNHPNQSFLWKSSLRKRLHYMEVDQTYLGPRRYQLPL